MAKNKKPQQQDQAPAPEKGLGASIVESIGNAVDKVLHPEHAEEKTQAQIDAEETHVDHADEKSASPAAGKQSSEPESETGPAVEMQDHPKFDKFNGGIS